jgi:hypothetical protein
MWANCESFTWEKATNDRSSALVPSAFSRLLGQQQAATAGGADRIIAFVFCGLFEDPSSPYHIGQPHWSVLAHEDYMSWLRGDRYWKAAEDAMLGKFGPVASEDATDPRWVEYAAGTHEIEIPVAEGKANEVLVRMLNSHKDGIVPPSKIFLFASEDGQKWSLVQVKDSPVFPNTLHDAYVDHVLFDVHDMKAPYMKIAFTAEEKAYLDKVILN